MKADGNIFNAYSFQYITGNGTLRDPIPMIGFVITFLAIHVLDYIIHNLTIEKWDLWNVIYPEKARKLKELCVEEDNCSRYYWAWAKYFLLWGVRSIIMWILVSFALKFRSCEPIITSYIC